MRGFLLKKRRLITHHKPSKVSKNFSLTKNDLLEYNVNINVAKKGEGTMLVCPSDLEQFGQRVNVKRV